MKTRKIYIMASHDWSMRWGVMEFMKFLNRTVKYKGEEYQIELGRVIAHPIKCGADLSPVADLIVDRTVHWNDYYKCWAQQAMNSQVKMVNNVHTFANYDKHSTYDLMARLIHPKDYFPVTVLLPQFSPYTDDQKAHERWRYEQEVILENTKCGWDQNRRWTDWDKVNDKMKEFDDFRGKSAKVRELFYPAHNYIEEAMEKYFDNKFPVFFKKPFGGGGRDVYKVNSLQELYDRYDQSEGKVFHIQESIENYDLFIRCMGIGPQVLPMRYEAEMPLHQHYNPEKLKVDQEIFGRLENYVLFINAYHRWTYNSFETLIKDGRLCPIDFANACPDSNFTSLHTHFPWLINALVRWLTFCAVTDMDMRIDLEEEEYLTIMNDQSLSGEERYERVSQMNRDYFQISKFEEYCEENFSDIEDRMIEFYDQKIDELIAHAIAMSNFPKEEHQNFIYYYKDMMERYFRPNAKDYLTTVIYH